MDVSRLTFGAVSYSLTSYRQYTGIRTVLCTVVDQGRYRRLFTVME